MSCHIIYYQDGAKLTRPISTPQEYLALRSGGRQQENVERARQGDGAAKRHLLQFNYSCVPEAGGKLRGCRTPSRSVGMDVDFKVPQELPGDCDAGAWLTGQFAAARDTILAKRNELGLLMLERSASKGFHLVFRRHADMTQEENLQWASRLLGVDYDAGAKDITRVFFTTTASPQDLLFLDDELFDNRPGGPGPADSAEPQAPASPEPAAPASPEPAAPASSEPLLVLPYDAIIRLWAPMKEPSFPHVPEGLRNTTLFTLCNGLRYIVDHSEKKLKEILWPTFCFGLPEEEVDTVIRSALMRERGLMPRDLREVITLILSPHGAAQEGTAPASSAAASLRVLPVPSAPSSPVSERSPYPSVSQCILDEMDLPPLPRWMEALFTPVLPGYRFLTLCGCYTAMMTLLSDVRRKFASKGVSRLNGWTHWDGLSGSGKRQLREVIEALIRPLRQQDKRTREVLNQVIEQNSVAKEGEKRPLPQLGFRILESDTTRKAHILQMSYLKGKKTFTFAEEISSLNLNRQGYYFRGDFCRLMFDNGLVGCLNAMGDSVSLQTPCNWDVTTSGTHDQTLRQWGRNLADGSAQRVLICLVPDNTYQPTPTYRQYSEEDLALIDRATALMQQMQGLVRTPRLDKALLEWLEQVRTELEALPPSERNDQRARFRFRSAEIAHTLGATLHCAYIVQDIMDREDELLAALHGAQKSLDALRTDIEATPAALAEAEREVIARRDALESWKLRSLDLEQYGEHRAVTLLALRTATYCLDTQDLLWSKKLRTEQQASYEGIGDTSTRIHRVDDYQRMPQRFTMEVLMQMMPDKSAVAIRKMISRFMESHLLRKVGTEKGKAIYEKTA